MQQEIIQKQNDSDNDEGFIVNPLQIKQKQTCRINQQQRPNDYQPRYISTHNVIRKQILELVTSYPHFGNNEQLNSQNFTHKKNIQRLMHPQQRYFNNKSYRLVYQRLTKRAQGNDSYSQYDINLGSVVTFSQDNYSILKNWQLRNQKEQLTFQSRFQSGNLALAFKSLIQVNTYILFVQNDSNSKGYNKWFYFAVKNIQKNITYTFSIVNFRKKLNFLKQGMRPTRFSLKQHQQTGNGWSKCGKNIQTCKSQLSLSRDPQANQFYTLSFDVLLQHEKDINFFSLLPPYSYSKLTNFLQEAKNTIEQRQDLKFQLNTIAYTLTNTQVPYVTISSQQASKKNIVVLARQHPGQVWSSFMAESIIRQLIRDSKQDKDWLLRNYTFKIFPMINIDGVIYGNFRCDLAGMDLNRNWKSPTKLLHPHIVAIKDEIARLSSEEQIVCCLDLHAHSKQYNIFAYCSQTDNKGRVLPFLLSRMTPLFHFPSCTYGISKYKQTTARAIIYEITKAENVLTIQTSFFGTNNPFKTLHPSAFLSFANALIKTLKYYYSKSKELTQAQQVLPKAMAQIAQIRAKNKEKLFRQQSGSDSQPECDQIALTEKIGSILPKLAIVQIALGISKPEEKVQQNKGKSILPINKIKKAQSKLKRFSQLDEIQPPKESILTKKNQKPLTIFPKAKIFSQEKDNVKSKGKRSDQKSSQHKQTSKNKNTSRQDNRFQSIELPPAKNTARNSFLATDFRLTSRKLQSNYTIQYKYQRKQQEQFPLLCVLSDRKRQAHLQKLRRIHPTPQRQKLIPRYQPTLIINRKLDTIQRLRQRQKNSDDLVSSIWKESLEDYPIRSIFYGGL